MTSEPSSLVERVIRRPVTVAVGVILVLLFGTISVYRMPMQLTPEVQTPTLTIDTRWPGASPQEIESEIIQEQEEQLQSVEGVHKMTSESMDSLGRITLEFHVDTNMQEALLLVNTRLQQVREYPVNADEPVITTTNSSDRFIAWFILNRRTPTADDFAAFVAKNGDLAAAIEPVRKAHNPGLMLYRLRELAKTEPRARELLPPDVDITTLRRYAEDHIEARFERVPGVANSNVVGGREEELQVVVDPHRLAARQLTIPQVRDALRAANKDTSGGDFWEGKRRYVVRTLGQFRSYDQVANTIVARRDGSPVYVKDVAEVRLGYKKPDGMVRRFGSDVIAINVQRETTANILDVMQGLREANAQLNRDVLRPRGLELALVYDETEYIYSAIGLVNDNIFEGGALTFICLMVFLRDLRSTVVVFLSIGVSIVGMFLVMNLLGRSLNVLSLAGIAFAVGMLVDNFIVVMENVYRHHQAGDGVWEATVRGTRDVWGAIVASTLANLAVFVPVLFVRDEAGQLFRDIAIATSAALAISLLVSLLVVPTAACRLLRSRAPGHGMPGHSEPPRRWPGQVFLQRVILDPLDVFGRWFVQTVVAINAWVQQSLLLRLATVGVFVFGAIGISWLLMPKVEYLPNGNRNLVICLMLPPPGYNLDHMQQMGALIESELRPYWDVDAGSPAAAKLKYPPIGDFFYVARGRTLFMGLRAADPLRAGELAPLIRSLGAKLPGTFLNSFQMSLFEQGLSGGRNIDIEITGPDIVKLVRLGGRVIGQVGNPDDPVVPGAQSRPVPSLDLSAPEIHAIPKWEQAADMGFSATDIGYTVDALVDGAYATDYFLGGDKIDLSIVGEERFATQTQDLASLPMATPHGELVTLAAVADIVLASGPEQINHRERLRAITISVQPPPEMAVEDAMDAILSRIVEPLEKGPELEGGLYQVNLSGTADKLRTTWISLRWNLVLAMVITYLVMAALFESWLYPFVIMLSVPLGAVGGFLGLRLLNLFVLQPLDVLTMLGFIILVGTVVNNPILIVEQALVHIREEGMPHREAILQSVRTRIRPIFMTALIGLFGLLPLVVSPGAGSELYRGLGSVMLGGLLVSTMFTLVLVPTLFSLTLEAKESLLSAWRRRGTRRAEKLALSGENGEAAHFPPLPLGEGRGEGVQGLPRQPR